MISARLSIDVWLFIPCSLPGQLLEAYATHPRLRRWLIRIPDWDINWQAVFSYRVPLSRRGSIVSMRYRFDNSAANRNPNYRRNVFVPQPSTDDGPLVAQACRGAAMAARRCGSTARHRTRST
jgi:hypothetical protein